MSKSHEEKPARGIMVFTFIDECERTGRRQRLVDYGVDLETDRMVPMPSDTPAAVGAIFDRDLGEYLIPA